MKKTRKLIYSYVLAFILSLCLAGQALAFPIIPIDPIDPIIIPPIILDISGDFTDPAFKRYVWYWLGRNGTPGSFTQQDIDDRIANVFQIINCPQNDITSLAGIEHFNGLKELYCDGNRLTTLQGLPDTIVTLACGENQITSISDLPDNLERFNCSFNQLTNLPKLPNNIKEVLCQNNNITSIPSLPISIIYLDISDNPIKMLPSLMNLNQLYCSGCLLKTLPSLPFDLEKLDCSYNYLNVFLDPLKTQLTNSFVVDNTYKPQCRVKYVGTDLTLDIGATRQLGSDIKKQISSDGAIWGDVENAAFSNLTFSSSNNAVAKVDSTGLISAQGTGSCTITVIFSGVDTALTKTTVPVTVTNKVAAGADRPVDYLSASSWAISELEQAEQYGLFTDQVKDKLTQDITREEFCGVAVKLYETLTGSTAVPVAVNPFTDTSNSDCLKAYKLDIIRGATPTTFAPNNQITRQEMCVMIFRALKAAIPNLNTSVSGVGQFADESQIASWAINEVRFANKHGIMNGTGGNHIDPLDNTERQVAVIIVKRTYESFR